MRFFPHLKLYTIYEREEYELYLHTFPSNFVYTNSNVDHLMLKQLQLSFQLWTSQMQETLNLKKHGDAAFRAKDFVTAIDCYTQVRGF